MPDCDSIWGDPPPRNPEDTMELSEVVDTRIAHWKDNLKVIRRGIVEIEADPYYDYMQSGAPIIGITFNEVAALKAEISKLDDCILHMSRIVNTAEDKRRKVWAWNLDELGQIKLLFENPMYNMTITESHSHANAALLSAKKILVRINMSVAHVEQMYLDCCGILSKMPANMVEDLVVNAAMIYSNATEDPIGSVERLHKEIKIQADLLNVQLSQNKELIEGMDLACKDLEMLKKDIQASKEFVRIGREKVSGIDIISYDNDIIELDAWMTRLKANCTKGKFQAANVGLAMWRKLALKVKDSCERNKEIMHNALTRREDYRGRFNALVMKRQALKVSETSILDLEKALKDLLFGNITPIPQAERMMKDYTARLAERKVP